jgi:quinol monooxygenase YgiN
VEFALLNKLTAKPGARARVVQLLVESGRLFDDNPACLLYLVGEARDDPDVIWVTDLWTSEAEHSEALKAPELRPYINETIPLLVGMPEQTPLRSASGKLPNREGGQRP